jgi:hypothetical protein
MKQHGKPMERKRRHRRDDRGSALLVSLMVMVGLSLLGLSFVAISETENAISVNERNKTQTAAMAEAGAKAVAEWFQDPVTMETRGLLPPNTSDTHFKIERTVNAYKGYYRPAGGRLFDTPFGPKEADMLFGDEDHADFAIVAGKTESDDFLAKLNKTLFYDGDPTARITAIRIYAPPNVGGVLVNGFWVAGQRMGVATIAVTAEKTNDAGKVLSQSICRLVLAPFPLPGPSGAIQALGTIDTNGAYEVHWGATESEDTALLEVKREQTSLPWFDAYDLPYFEYGLDASTAYVPGGNYQAHAAPFPNGFVVRPSDAAIAAKHAYMVVATKAPHTAPNPEPEWDQTPGSVKEYGNVTFREVTPPAYKISTGGGSPYPQYDNHNWLSELVDRGVEDPWFQVRAKGQIKGKDTGTGPAGDPQFFNYETQGMGNVGSFAVKPLTAKNGSNYFQYQTFDNRPNYRQVRVPRFDYDFWKAAALAGRGQEGVYYLKWDATAKLFTNDLKKQSIEAWLAEGPGFFFFETENAMNPQNKGPGKLVATDGSPCGAKGVVYMNITNLKSTGKGCDGEAGWYNQPGEPYRDVGFRKVNEVSVGTQTQKNFTTDAAGQPIIDKAYNGQWDWQDLAWSNGGSSKNGIFDVCLGERPMYQESTNSVVKRWVPLPYFPNCKVGNNVSMGGCNCSEPFEPYLNFRYAGTKLAVTPGWTNPNDAAGVYPKKTTDNKPTGTKVTCAATAVASKTAQDDCSSNAWDKKGALAWIAADGNMKPITFEGVVYNEGDYNSTGNAAYFGSVVVGGKVSPQGTQEIWYDACLASDCWPPPHIPFPRVMITSTQIQ